VPGGQRMGSCLGAHPPAPDPTPPPAHFQALSNTLSDEKGKRHDFNLTSHPKLCL